MQRQYGNWTLRTAGLLLVVVACGCGGPSLTPVKGVVKVDGKPAKGVLLTFFKENAGMDSTPASATSGEGGAFTLVTGERGGAEPGKYKVSAIYPDPNIQLSEKDKMQGATIYDGPDLLKGKYAPNKSTLTVEVKAGSTDLEPLELKAS
jgi:hypothetical protein